ncbi:MAG: UDP-N-acetylglucosamine 4,6-dehydratase, partial [Deltaproteobacteria bacterium]
AVRFGNVLGSSGSVVPLFERQIAQNQPLSVTHEEVRRFFMLTKEACELVLQAASLGEDGEIFILDMGKPVKIIDLAKKMLMLHQKEHLGIKIIGLKPGEKLYEELLIDKNDTATKYPSIFIAPKTAFDIEALNAKIIELLNKDDKEAVLMDIVREFRRP